jgi:hypothetical protein
MLLVVILKNVCGNGLVFARGEVATGPSVIVSCLGMVRVVMRPLLGVGR